MALLPTPEININDVLESVEIEFPLPKYLGMTSLGHICDRYLWLSFRWAYYNTGTPQTKRIRNKLALEEKIVIQELEELGMTVSYSGDEKKRYHDSTGHCVGYCQGFVTDVPTAEKTEHVLIIKSLSEKVFTQIRRFGVYRASPKYYCLALILMQMSKKKRAFFVLTNRNNEERYYERISYEPNAAKMVEQRGEVIIGSASPPARISEKPEWYQCRGCSAKDVCFKAVQARISCRTCGQATIIHDGTWRCETSGQVLTEEDQDDACSLYQAIHVA